MPAAQGKIATTTEIRDQPAYSLAEGSRYLRLPVATLRAWVLGRAYPTAGGARHFQPLVRPARRRPPQLSFWNLIEAHVLRSLRTDHGVSLRALRQALTYAQRELRIERLLLSQELCTDAGQLFLDRYRALINLSASGQLAMRRLFDQHLKRVEWDAWKFPVRLYPFLTADLPAEDRPIAIDPHIAFGRPVLVRSGISTAVLADRMDAGEAVEDLADDYSLTRAEIEQAVLYERTA
jgi:uncharacterized protein (DUF433 family)